MASLNFGPSMASGVVGTGTVTGGGTVATGGFTLTLGRNETMTAPTTADALADVMWGTSATTQKGLVIQGKASQTASLLEVQDSTGQRYLQIAEASCRIGSDRTNGLYFSNGSPIRLSSTSGLVWTTSVDGGDTTDIGLIRSAAGVVKVTDGSTGIKGFLGGGASVASADPLPVPTGRVFHVTGTTNFTNITATNLQSGTVITLIFDGVLTVTDGGNLKLAAAYVTTADDTLTLVYDGTNFYEMCRSAN